MIEDLIVTPVAIDKFKFTGINMKLEDEWTFVGVHGGGERNWGADHCTVRFFAGMGCKHFKSVHLPLHNKRGTHCAFDAPSMDSSAPPSLGEYLDGVLATLEGSLRDKRVIFVAHSSGAFALFSIWEKLYPMLHPDSFLVCIGASLVETSGSGVISAFWTVDHHREAKQLPILGKIHQTEARAKRLIQFIGKHNGPGGDLFRSVAEARALTAKEGPFRSRVFWVHGEQEEPFVFSDFCEAFDRTYLASNVFACTSGHFTYFNQHQWETSVRKALIAAVLRATPKVSVEGEVPKLKRTANL